MRLAFNDQRPNSGNRMATVRPSSIGVAGQQSVTHPMLNISQRRTAAIDRSKTVSPSPSLIRNVKHRNRQRGQQIRPEQLVLPDEVQDGAVEDFGLLPVR